MPRFIVFVLLMGAGIGTCAEPPPVAIPDTEQWDLKSAQGQTYRVFVSAPQGNMPTTGWPVIYVTDGNLNFLVMHAAVRRQIASAVIVGIGYPETDHYTQLSRRAYDLTSPESEAFRKRYPPGGLVKETGGNERFLAILEDTVKPRVEKQFTIDRGRQALFGHSLGGSFAVHVLFAKPAAFQTYVASSPSLWWNDNDIRAEEDAFVAKRAAGVTARVLVTVGALEETADLGGKIKLADGLWDGQMVTRAKAMAERLEKVKGLTVVYRAFDDEDHRTVLLPAAGRGARFHLEAKKPATSP